MKVSLIWAMARNRVIGRGNRLPWHLPREMKYFMTTTRDHPVIMGRRTFESMERKPLPRRHNIVVTRNPHYQAPGAVVAPSLEAALAEAAESCRATGAGEVFVIGGAELYVLAWDLADRLYVTDVDADVAGDTVFPDLDWRPWQRISSETFPADESHAYAFTISVFERRQPVAEEA